jgi:hypothetical protein
MLCPDIALIGRIGQVCPVPVRTTTSPRLRWTVFELNSSCEKSLSRFVAIDEV